MEHSRFGRHTAHVPTGLNRNVGTQVVVPYGCPASVFAQPNTLFQYYQYHTSSIILLYIKTLTGAPHLELLQQSHAVCLYSHAPGVICTAAARNAVVPGIRHLELLHQRYAIKRSPAPDAIKSYTGSVKRSCGVAASFIAIYHYTLSDEPSTLQCYSTRHTPSVQL